MNAECGLCDASLNLGRSKISRVIGDDRSFPPIEMLEVNHHQ
jgi:hypothetical protein